MIYRKNLCLYSEFKNMTKNQRQEYLNEIYDSVSEHRVIAKIKEISPIVIRIEVAYFIFSGNVMQKFQLCRDTPLSTIGSTGFYDRDFSQNDIIDYCEQKNFSVGDEIACEIIADARYPLTFFITSLEKVSVKNIREIYREIGIPYESDKLFELREENSTGLEILIYGDLSKKLQQLIDAKKAELNNLDGELNFLRAYRNVRENSIETAEKNYDEEDLFEPETYSTMLKNLRDYLCTAFELRYSYETLEMVYLALQTNQLILLVGAPGTGKTSLVRYLAKSFKFADSAIIPVQSNWADKSDLLGYYNPLEKNYVATPFLDALINFSRQAKVHPDKLYIICLDEMNLAHVEYYFAEFLSILQDSRVVRLYSDSLRQDILNELKHSGFEIVDGKIIYDGTPIEKIFLEERKYYFELCRLAQMINRYPAAFEIPANVKFFGTLNQDETTLDISPKVLDRSFVIRLETYDAAQNFSENTKPVRYKPLEKFPPLYEDTEIIDSFIAEMRKIAHISPRVTNQFLNNNFQNYIAEDKFEDYIIAGCLLPKIRFSENEYADKIDALKNLCDGRKISQAILSEIDDGAEADYWRRSR